MATTRPPNKRLGNKIEEQRAEARDAPHTPEAAFYDVDDSDPVEVKTTAKTVESGDERRKGRYQLIGDNHQRLAEAGGEYDFVLRDGEETTVETKTALEVDQIIDAAGLKWPQNSKLKLRYDLIHND